MKIYVASRASVPARSQMWRDFRDNARVNIVSSWIDEAGPGETASMSDLWTRVLQEIAGADRLVLYVEPDDFPLKGALVEIGVALACDVPVYVVAPLVQQTPDYRPLGSWVTHPLVSFEPDLMVAMGLAVEVTRV